MEEKYRIIENAIASSYGGSGFDSSYRSLVSVSAEVELANAEQGESIGYTASGIRVEENRRTSESLRRSVEANVAKASELPVSFMMKEVLGTDNETAVEKTSQFGGKTIRHDIASGTYYIDNEMCTETRSTASLALS